MAHQMPNGHAISEAIRLAREFEYIHQSIQLTAEEERRIHEEALSVAYRRHEEIRETAEREGRRALEDLIQHQRLLEDEEALRYEQARKEATEKAFLIEQRKRETIAATQAAEEALQTQREANIAAQKKIEEVRARTLLAQQQTAPATNSTPIPSPIRPSAPSSHASDPVKSQPPQIAPVLPPAQPPNAHAQPKSNIQAPVATTRVGSKTYLGLPFPATLTPELQQRYLELIEVLMRLKEHRKIFIEQILPDPQYQRIKGQVGEHRRFIRKSVSQLTEDRKKNKEIMDAVINKINSALQSPFPKVKLSKFLPGLPDGVPEVSSLYIYLLNIFTKAIFGQFLVDACLDKKKADPLGMFASQLLATAQTQWQNQVSFWPFLAAKFARRCPVLFGVYGNENTTEGKVLLGWGKEDGRFVTDQRHAERMTGLSAGWASITLRDYNKSRMENPAPSWYFWRSMAVILNVPADSITNTHYLVLKGLVEHNEQRILKLFGNYGRIVLRQSVMDYPNNQFTGKSVSAQGLRILKDIWEKDLNLRFV